MPLDEYRRKRDFGKTPEPAPAVVTGTTGRFVIQRHRATRLHYDFRLEIEGVLVSWAVPKGPTLDSSIRRMAVHVEDHPIEYFDFEGVIPSKQYGAGDVIVWDWGTWEPEAPTLDPRRAIEDGELKFVLHGQKVNGRFTIVRTSGRRRKGDDPAARAFEDDEGQQWLLIKKRDEAYVAGWDAEDHPQSVKTGRTNDDVKADRDALWNGEAPAAAAEIDLTGAVEAQDAALHRADAGHARVEGVQRPGLAVRDQVGRVPRAGRRRRREGQDLDPRPQGRRDLFPATAVAGLVDRRQAGHRRWRGRGPRRGRAPGFLAAPDEARPEGGRRPRLPAVRPALSRRPARCSTSRSRIASGCSRACSRATRGSASRRTSSARARRSSRRRGANQLEGIIAKLRRSRYEPGRRSKAWLKLKVRPEQELVIAGWTPGEGNARDLGALAVGYYEDGKLKFAGKVGSGFTGAMRKELLVEAQAAGDRRLALRRAAAQGLQGSMGRRSRCGDLGPARARDARGARRLDA